MSTLLVVSGSIRKLSWRSLVVDLDTDVLSVGGQAVPVSRAECRVVATLLSQRNMPLTKQSITDAVFGPAHDRDARQIDMFVARLRRALAAAGLPDAIQTVPGRGYAMMDEDRVCPLPELQSRPEPALVAA